LFLGTQGSSEDISSDRNRVLPLVLKNYFSGEGSCMRAARSSTQQYESLIANEASG